MIEGRWLDDPTGRFRKRWHDGTAWTDFVTNDGPAARDPMGAPPASPAPWSGVPFTSDVPPPPSTAYGPYGAYPGASVYFPPQKGTNGLAVASLVLGILWLYFLGSILAVIFGHVALSQIDRDRSQGRGLAIAGLVLGYIGIAFGVLLIVLVAAL